MSIIIRCTRLTFSVVSYFTAIRGSSRSTPPALYAEYARGTLPMQRSRRRKVDSASAVLRREYMPLFCHSGTSGMVEVRTEGCLGVARIER